jgi:hypothetical protein
MTAIRVLVLVFALMPFSVRAQNSSLSPEPSDRQVLKPQELDALSRRSRCIQTRCWPKC